MSLIFFGSSDFSLHALRACLDSGQDVSLVITTPPQKKGRGLIQSPTPVQTFAEVNRLPFIVPATLKNPEVLEKVRKWAPDFFVVSSYGKIIPGAWLKVPRRYGLNVHPSLLPKYRGAAPIHWPIILGDQETGISIAEVTPELDAGDIFFQKSLPLPPEADAQRMAEILGEASGHAVKTIFEMLQKGSLPRTIQQHELSNYARKLAKEDGKINWNRSAVQLHNQIRGLVPWPTASFVWEGESVQILKGSLQNSNGFTAVPGCVLAVSQHAIHVQTGKGILSLDQVQPAGRKEMTGGDYARGRRINPGVLFPSDPEASEFILSSSYQ